jgi:uncharacterized membrane protein YebE (DUF533 family)
MSRLGTLTRRQRLQLLRFVCAAAWADLEVSRSEKSFILDLALRLGIPEDEAEQVKGWLETPPPPEAVDPADVPREHRHLFREAIAAAVVADGVVDGPERESLRLLHELLA